MATSQVIDHARPRRSMRGRFWRFFPMASTVLLAIVLFGFAKTFFLRSLFSVPPIPTHLYVHGTLLTSWYVLVFTQTWLIAADRTDLHRRLGWFGAAVAALLVPVSAYAVWQYVPRALARGRDLGSIRGLVVGDQISLVIFAVVVTAGITFRRRPDVHKRLMLASCFVILVPALERFYFSYGLPIRGLPTEPILFFATFLIYDLLSIRRLHPATLWLFGGVLVVFNALQWAAISTGFADAFIAAAR